jgi:hypothetical protein
MHARFFQYLLLRAKELHVLNRTFMRGLDSFRRKTSLSTTIMHEGGGGNAASDGRFVDNKGLKIFSRLVTEEVAHFCGSAKLLNSFKNNLYGKRGRRMLVSPFLCVDN